MMNACKLCQTSRVAVSHPQVLPIRTLHAFAPSAPSLRKKVAAAEEDFEEFAEDEFEDELEELSETVSPGNNGPSRAETYAASRDGLNQALARSEFNIRSNIPSSRALTRVIEHAPAEDVPVALNLVHQWRLKGLQIPRRVPALVARLLLKNQQAPLAVEVFGDHQKYGLDLPSTGNDIPNLPALYNSLATSESDASSALTSVRTLLRLQYLHQPQVVPVIGHVALLSLAIKAKDAGALAEAVGVVKAWSGEAVAAQGTSVTKAARVGAYQVVGEILGSGEAKEVSSKLEKLKSTLVNNPSTLET